MTSSKAAEAPGLDTTRVTTQTKASGTGCAITNTLFVLAVLLGAAFVPASAFAQNMAATIAVGTSSRAVAINPVSNKIYVANQSEDNVTVIDGASSASTQHTTSVAMPGANATSLTNPTLSLTDTSAVSGTQVSSLTTVAASQSITFAAIAPTLEISPLPRPSFSATATSGLPVVYSVPVTTNVCSVDASSGLFAFQGGVGTCTVAADQAGNSAFSAAPQVTQSIIVQDTTPPVLTLPASISLIGTSPAGRVYTYAPTAFDYVNGSRPVTCTPASGFTFPYGVTTVNCSANDLNGNFSTGSFTVTILPASQSITFAAIAPTLEISPLPRPSFSATATSGLPVVYSVPVTTNVCSVDASSGLFAFQGGVGTCTVAADQAGNSAFSAAPQVTQSIIVQDTTPPVLTLPASISLIGTSPAGRVYTYAPTAFDYVNGSRPVTCTPASGFTFPYGVTTVNCSANDLNGNFSTGSFTVTILPASQSITFGAAPTPTYAPLGTFTVSATASSTLTVTYSVPVTTSVCSVNASSGLVTILTAGTCTVAADQAGNASFAVAPQVTQSVTIAKATQAALTAASTLTTLNVNQSATLSATGGSSTGALSFASNNANCTVTAGTTLTAAAAGNCIITATKAADSNYNAVSGTVNITTQTASQSISFGAAPTPTYAPLGTFTVSATASSTLTVTYSVPVTTSVCSVNASSGLVTILTAGTCTVAADQAGNASFAVAPQVTQSVTIAKATQAALTAASTLTTLNVNQSATLSATGGSSTGALSFASNNANCTVTAGTTLTAAAAGNCIITATKAADSNYNAVSGTVNITTQTASQTIIFAPATPVAFGVGPITLTASASSGLTAFTFSSSSAASICTVSGNQLIVVGVGTCALTAGQVGNANYSSASANANVVVTAASQTLTFGAAPSIPKNTTGTVSATSTNPNSGNSIVFTSATPSVCSVSGNVVTGIDAGICVIAANQAGNTNFNAAAPVTQNITIGVALCRLDVDGDGTHSALIDGQLLIRHLLGITGPSLVAAIPAFPLSAQRTTDGVISRYLNTLDLDIDGSGGAPLAATDGMIVLRAMLGFSGAAVTAGLPIPVGALRSDWTTIGPYLSGTCLMPVAP